MTTRQTTLTILIAAIAIVAAATLSVTPIEATKTVAAAKPTQAEVVARGEYLVTVGGCNDCHTPLKMGPKGPEPDMSRALSGHPEQLVMPEAPKLPAGPWMWVGGATNTAFAGPWGVSYARNLTPEPLTGTGIWTEDIFVKTIRTGRHWGVARPIMPPMPWFNYAKMSDEDLHAVFSYLRTVKPVRNEVPEPIIAPPPPGAPQG